MGAANQLVDSYTCKERSLNLISDPGNGGTISPVFDAGICLITLSGAGETRSLRSAS